MKTLYIVGLAFDYCVGRTAIDAVKHGFKTHVIKDLTKSVSSKTEAVMKTRLQTYGAKIIKLSELKSQFMSSSGNTRYYKLKKPTQDELPDMGNEFNKLL